MRLAVFEKALEDFKGELADFDPALITTGAATRAFEVFSAVSRIMVTATTLVAGRAAEGGAWRDAGHRSAADWMAATTGSGVSESIGVLETSEQLVALPETTEALRRGELSGSQLKVIAATAAENPSAERELLDTARHDSLKALKEQSLRVKARAGSEDDARARYEKIRKNRSLHLWTDDDGVGRLDARLPPDDFARLAGAIRLESNAIFGEARRAGRREPGRAYDADALVALVTGTSTTGPSASTGPSTGTGPSTTGAQTGTGTTGRTTKSGGSSSSRPTTLMHLRVDLAALRRGELEGQETCEIAGVGPVPLATAVNVIGESILKVIISDGVDVTTVCHVGRAVPAHIRSALEDRDPTCVVPGCGTDKGLEIDHYRIAFAHDGPTELWNLCRLCKRHHYLKTHLGYAITGEPGRWEWNGPGSDENPILTA